MKKLFLLTGTLLLLMVGFSNNVFAQITVTDGGADVNGSYPNTFSFGDRTAYSRDMAIIAVILWRSDFSEWRFTDGSGNGTYYYNTANTILPPATGWVVDGGTGPAPTLSGSVDPMPVELTSFTAIAKEKNVELKWNTATEVNNYGFEIEKKRMKDELGNMNWEKIGFVEGNGTTNAPKNYSFTDKSAAGKISYRLKQIDRDGKFEYSQE
ncbi:MAG TPA: hypothetical protein DCQ28_05680, partial [Bacteroidetes bacterium]|nr:hypothetical protein [Bacteroidota bacterium]